MVHRRIDPPVVIHTASVHYIDHPCRIIDLQNAVVVLLLLERAKADFGIDFVAARFIVKDKTGAVQKIRKAGIDKDGVIDFPPFHVGSAPTVHDAPNRTVVKLNYIAPPVQRNRVPVWFRVDFTMYGCYRGKSHDKPREINEHFMHILPVNSVSCESNLWKNCCKDYS